MTFCPSTSSPISIPNSAKFPDGLQLLTGTINQSTLDIVSLLNISGYAALFQNPITLNLNNLGSNVTRLNTSIGNSTCMEAGDQVSMLAATTSLTTKIAALRAHTDLLSGSVAPSLTAATPHLDQLISVGLELNNLGSMIDGSISCLCMMDSMTGLYMGSTLDGYTSQLGGIINQVDACVFEITALLASINAMIAAIQATIAADQAFFNNLLDLLRKFALASVLSSFNSNPCGKFLLNNVVGQQNLLSILNK